MVKDLPIYLATKTQFKYRMNLTPNRENTRRLLRLEPALLLASSLLLDEDSLK